MNTEAIERRTTYRPIPQPADAFGLRGAADAVLQHGRLAAGLFVAVLAAALLYGMLAALVYRADALLQIDYRTAPPAWASAREGAERAVDSARGMVASEIEVLGSREVLGPAIAATGADVQTDGARRYGVLPVGRHHGLEVAEFKLPPDQLDRAFTLAVDDGRWTLVGPDPAPLATGRLGETVRFNIGRGSGSLLVHGAADLPPTRLTLRQLSPVEAHQEVLKRLRMFEAARESGTVRMSFEDGSPQRAAALLNELVGSYTAFIIRRRAEETDRTLSFLDRQLPAARQRLDVAEQALSTYGHEGNAATSGVEADALLRQRTDLERQAVDLQTRRALLGQTLTDQHPDLAGVNRQIATVEAALARLGGRVRRLPEQQRDVGRLQRVAQSEQQLYGAMMAQAQQLRILGNGWQASARQLDRAAVPVEPLRPRMGAVLSMGVGAGLLLALAGALLARSLQPTVVSVHELQTPGVPPILAVVGESRAQQRLMEWRVGDEVVEDMGTHALVALAAPEDPAVDALRSVHLSLLLRGRSVANKVIMITSPSQGTGKSFIAANLAALMAEGGKRVLLIEADLRNPGLHKFVGLDEYAPGLSDMLAGKLALSEVIYPHATAGMDVILHGVSVDTPGTMLLSREFESALTQLRERYDHILVNAPPMLPARDALAISCLTDIALMVLRAEFSGLHETRVALRRLEQSGVRVEGLLLNGVKRGRLSPPMLS